MTHAQSPTREIWTMDSDTFLGRTHVVIRGRRGGPGGEGGGGPKEGRPMDLPVFVLPSHEYYEVLYTSFF